jgi:hypothetical protein
MTSFDKREKAYEAEFAHREELKFKAREQAIELLALWAAERLGKSAQAGEVYAKDIVAMDIANPDGALGRVLTDLRATGISEQEVRRTRDGFLAQANVTLRSQVP